MIEAPRYLLLRIPWSATAVFEGSQVLSSRKSGPLFLKASGQQDLKGRRLVLLQTTEFRPACKECISLPHTGERDREGFKGGTVAGLLFSMGWSEQTSLLQGIFELRSGGKWVSHKDL